ncbi:MAG: rhodanese-like domain-containing protein [Phycisphaerales bacterium]|nr:rhodanese-like domain-containing protein [Phycisphaerales bacterium]
MSAPETNFDQEWNAAELEVSVAMTHAMRTAGAPFVLVDCRGEDEHDLCRLEPSVLLPMDELDDRLELLDGRENDRIIVYCRSGRRSLFVASALRARGFAHAKSMAGGILAWSRDIDPSIPQY